MALENFRSVGMLIALIVLVAAVVLILVPAATSPWMVLVLIAALAVATLVT